MNRENLKAWVRALVSEEYLQTTGQLAKADDSAEKGARFCCLGVACDVSGVGNWSSAGRGRTQTGMVYESAGYNLYEGAGYNAELQMPGEVVMWLFGDELGDDDSDNDNDADPTLRHPDGRTHSASVWNDRLGATFIDIAKLVVHTYELDPELIPEEHR